MSDGDALESRVRDLIRRVSPRPRSWDKRTGLGPSYLLIRIERR